MKIDMNGLISRGLMTVKKHTPEILVTLGVGGTVTATVVACRATHNHLGRVISDHNTRLEKIEELEPKESVRKEVSKAYLATGLDVIRVYAPAATIETASIVSILAGMNILRKRNVALAAAYALVDQSFKSYRGRVVERYGSEVDKELRNDLHQEKIDETVIDEDGKKKKVRKTVEVAGAGGLSDYSRYFTFGEAKAAEQNDDYNMFFLKAQQETANHILRAKGFLFLNDVYDMLGIDRSLAGQTVGWVYDKNSEDHGDNYIDFGIQEVYRKKGDGSEDYEKVLLLDFNVDGSILDHTLNKGLITQ